MIEQTLWTFCHSRYRLAIVTAGTFVVGLVLVMPLVDVYCAARREKVALLADVETASQAADSIKQLEARATEKNAQLKATVPRTANERSLPELRSRLVELARETGCSLRRLTVGTMMSRPWHSGDDPVAKWTPTSSKQRGEATAYDLQWWPVSVSVSGSQESLRSMLTRMERDNKLMHTKALEMRPASAGRKTLALDMELWYFNLVSSGE
jgi:IS1 family transposase